MTHEIDYEFYGHGEWIGREMGHKGYYWLNIGYIYRAKHLGTFLMILRFKQ